MRRIGQIEKKSPRRGLLDGLAARLDPQPPRGTPGSMRVSCKSRMMDLMVSSTGPYLVTNIADIASIR